jgi:uncharacterized protein (TIGR03083 family)
VTTVELWAEGQRAMSDLGRSLTETDGATAVPACPDWTVREVFAHQAGVAADILGGRLDGVATDAWTRRQVAERADRSLAEILDEWDADAPRLVETMAPLGDSVDPRLLIDLWTHAQDVRGATGRPGDRTGTVADWVAGAARSNLEHRVREAGLPAIAVDLGDQPPPGPGGGVEVASFELSRALTGRRSPDQIRDWAWTVADPGPYIDLVPVFAPRPDDLVEEAAG